MSRCVLLTIACATVLTLAACTFDFARYRHAGAGGGTSSSSAGGSGGAGGVGTGGASGPGSVIWAYQLGGPALDLALGLDVTPDGDVVVAGSFTGALDLDANNSFVAQGTRDMFVVKLSGSGELLWASTHAGDGEIFVRDLAVDGFGNVIVVGAFNGTANFGGGPRGSADGLTTDLFAAKYGPAGNWIWDVVAGEAGAGDALHGVDASATGAIAIVGSFSASTMLGNVTGLTSVGGDDIVFALLDAQGAVSFATVYGDASANIARDVSFFPNGDALVVGTSQVGVDFGGGLLVGGMGSSITVAGIGPAGEHRFSHIYSSTGTDQGMVGAVDSGGTAWFAGLSAGDIDFGGGLRTGLGQDDIFVAQLDATGAHRWSDVFGDGMRQHARALATDSARNLIVAGALEGSADFGPTASIASQGQYDAFIAKLSPQGDALFARAFGDAATQRAHAVAADNTGIYVAGEFEGQLVLDDISLTSKDQLDGFVAKIRP